jgi:hypothetical protein
MHALTEAALGIFGYFRPSENSGCSGCCGISGPSDSITCVWYQLSDSEDDRPSQNPRKRKGCLTGGAMLIAAERPIIETLALVSRG